MDLMTSEQITELATAMVAVQTALKPAIKDSTNPHFNSRYADLSAVWDAARPALTAHGFSVIQSPDRRDGEVGVTTLLLHKSGQWVRGRVSARPQKDDPQGVGSCISYLRRYSLAAMAGVVSEDDDAEAAQGREPRGGAAGRGNGDTARARSPRPSRPAAGNPSPSSAGGTTHPGGISAATYEALTDLCQQLQAVGGDPGKVIHEITGKKKRAELTEEEGRAVGQAMLSLVVDGKKAGEAA